MVQRWNEGITIIRFLDCAAYYRLKTSIHTVYYLFTKYKFVENILQLVCIFLDWIRMPI